MVNNVETVPLVVAREIGAFPTVSVRERSVTDYVDLTSIDETAGKNEVAKKCLRQKQRVWFHPKAVEIVFLCVTDPEWKN